MRRTILTAFSLAFSAIMLPSLSFGQPLFGVGLTAGSLGAGIQGAVSVTKLSNIRGGFNDFSYSDTFTKDGITYGGTLNLRSVQLTYDQYIPHMGGFHISPGALIYNGNAGTASASVPAGQTFSLGATTYYSGEISATSPVTGTGTIGFNKAAPMVLIGFGNLLPRSSRHFGVSIEAGVVFQGSANAKLNLAGSACTVSAYAGCLNAATDPTVQANVQSEETKLNNDLNPFKYYPVISLGFSYKISR
jgi:hypothetical protein